MKLAFWPGLGGGRTSLAEVGPVLAAHGVDAVVLDPRYGTRTSWDLDGLADEVAGTGAAVYAGHSWGAAIAARAALVRPPDALVLLDGAYVSPAELTAFGAKETIDARIADIRAEHETYRWPSLNAYLESARESTPRWNEDIEAMALEGMRRERGEVLPPFDSDELEAIFRAYEAYDATSTLAGLADHVCVLLVVPPPAPAHAAARNRLLERFARLVPEADVREVDSPHDLIWGLGPSLGDLIGDWLRAEVAA